MTFDEYEYVDLDDNKYAVRYDPTERLPLQIRTPDYLWIVPQHYAITIRKLAEALHAANEEIEKLEEELEETHRRCIL